MGTVSTPTSGPVNWEAEAMRLYREATRAVQRAETAESELARLRGIMGKSEGERREAYAAAIHAVDYQGRLNNADVVNIVNAVLAADVS